MNLRRGRLATVPHANLTSVHTLAFSVGLLKAWAARALAVHQLRVELGRASDAVRAGGGPVRDGLTFCGIEKAQAVAKLD